jgi:hypothetical protein
VESPVLSNGHAGFGRRAWETDSEQSGHRAQVRPNNLAKAVEKTVIAHRACLREPEPEPSSAETVAAVPDTPLPVPDGTLDACGRERRLVTRTRERFAAVQEQRAQGLSLGAISRQLDLDHGTVRRFARATTVDELLVKAVNRTSTLDKFKSYVNQRWNEGCHDAAQLQTELQAQGWTGSVQTVRRYVHAYRATATPAPTAPAPPKPRRVVRWIMTAPGNLNTEDTARLTEILARCPELAATAGHVRDFAAMMRDLRGDQLDDWMHRVQADDLPALHSFVTGIKRDQDAVVNGLSLSWNSGAVEGAVTRIILWNLICQVHPCLPWFTETIGSRVAVAGTPISRGVAPAGVGMSTSRSSSWSRATWPSSTAARSSSVSGMVASIRCRLSLASNRCPFDDAFGV